jgi:2-iminobutanoate/2-iminopropanoate deaminase
VPKSLVQSDLFTPIGPYSHAVTAGDHLFISGTPGIDPNTGQLAGNDAYTQTQQILKNIHSLLASCGAQLDDVTHVQVNLVNLPTSALFL